ncbi:HdeD family acid-resistance protein [Dactylosporangium sp. CA-139114]|uniref:HdeD family acid-resistance protein n=1 Tax=Dactylosporangium sp. CA-139114 TaxID=3239931 RepID=UPI003D960D50
MELESRHLWSLVLRGAVAIVFGLLALVWPAVTVVVLALLVGAYLVVEGVTAIIAGFRRARDTAQRAAYLLAGLIGVVAGVVALLWPGVTALVLAVLFGVWALMTGVLEIWAATRVRGQWLMLAVGVLSVVAGVLVLVRPTLGVLAIALVVGVYALVVGALILVEAWREYRSRHTPMHHRPASAAH